ncbi:hypothetical protein OG422_28985 [Streptomyces sp. NBC_01525]
MAPGPLFIFGTHKEHGFVASFTSSIPLHLAHWFLSREQFEPVPGRPTLFRLSEPERDGPRRTRQAVHDLRHQGYAVHADFVLDAPASVGPSRPARLEHRSRLARAAAVRTTQRGIPSDRPIPPPPAYTPTVHRTASAPGRSR